jgi:hypothetical protein
VQKYSYLIIILLLFGCAPEKPQSPRDMLSQQQMSDIIAEMHLADAIINMKNITPDSAKQAGVNLREFIYEKHHTDHKQFTESFEFYKMNPMLMDSVYAEVIIKLSDKESLFRGKAGKLPIPIADTITVSDSSTIRKP